MVKQISSIHNAAKRVDFLSITVGFTIVIKWLKPDGAGIDYKLIK